MRSAGHRIGSGRIAVLAVAALALALVLARPREAAAQGVGVPTFSCDGGCGVLLAGAVLGGGFLSIGGIVTDVALTTNLVSRGYADHGWAVAGTVIWSINTLIAVPSTVAVLASDPSVEGGIGMGVLSALSVGSLALSVYGLMHPPPQPAAPGALMVPAGAVMVPSARGSSLRLLGFGPTMLPGRSGSTPGLTLTMAF